MPNWSYGPWEDIYGFRVENMIVLAICCQKTQPGWMFPLFKFMYRWFVSLWLSHHCVFFMGYVLYEIHFVPLAPFGSLLEALESSGICWQLDMIFRGKRLISRRLHTRISLPLFSSGIRQIWQCGVRNPLLGPHLHTLGVGVIMTWVKQTPSN